MSAFRKKFVIILGAGRCGTTYLLNELNKIDGVNIYGENYNSFLKIIAAISSVNGAIKKAINSSKISPIKDLDKYKNGSYIFTEWYNNIPKLQEIVNRLEECINFYFEDDYTVIGFKEIRFFDKKNVELLHFFEKKYDVYYIHLTRNIEEQSKSGFWVDIVNPEERIKTINKNIEDVLSRKKSYIKLDLLDIKNDISIIRKFIDI